MSSKAKWTKFTFLDPLTQKGKYLIILSNFVTFEKYPLIIPKYPCIKHNKVHKLINKSDLRINIEISIEMKSIDQPFDCRYFNKVKYALLVNRVTLNI